MEAFRDLGDAQRGLAQKECGFHQQHLVDVVDDGATARHLTDNAREICGGDTQLGSIEAYVMMLNKVAGQQVKESEEDFLDTLGKAVLSDTVLLDGGEVGEEKVIEHAQAVVGQRESHLLIVNHHLHQFAQTAKIVVFQRQYRRCEFDYREVGRTDGIAHRGQAECEVFVGQQADAAVVARRREDGYLEAGRIGIEVALTKRQFAIII